MAAEERASQELREGAAVVSMYRCLCEAVFERPNARREIICHGDGIVETQYIFSCPECGQEESYFRECTGEEEEEPT